MPTKRTKKPDSPPPDQCKRGLRRGQASSAASWRAFCHKCKKPLDVTYGELWIPVKCKECKGLLF